MQLGLQEATVQEAQRRRWNAPSGGTSESTALSAER